MNYKEALEQLQLINELNDIEKSILLKLIDTFVSKKRFKDNLQKKIAVLLTKKPGIARIFILVMV